MLVAAKLDKSEVATPAPSDALAAPSVSTLADRMLLNADNIAGEASLQTNLCQVTQDPMTQL